MSQSEQVTSFTVGNMGNCAGVEDIDISPIRRGYQVIPGLGELFSQKLGLGLIEFTALCI